MQLELDVSPAKEVAPNATDQDAPPRARSEFGNQDETTRRKRTEQTETGTVDMTTELSDDVLKSLESGQRAAIEAVRNFVDTVDERLPAIGGRPSRRKDIIDAAMEMADRLVETQYEFVRNVVQSAGRTLGRSGDGR